MTTTILGPDFVGATLTRVERVGDEAILFHADGSTWQMSHIQDCCEHVEIEDVCGNLDDLVGSPITQAEETISDADTGTWTFYRIGTAKGVVTIRWLGESNGCYSEVASFFRHLT